MALSPGTRLGVYEVAALIGEGGMGQVFRARDTKLNRDVALKVLPGSFANDSERLARFTREAQTLASLNHPHIAQIYGLEESPSALGRRADPGHHPLRRHGRRTEVPDQRTPAGDDGDAANPHHGGAELDGGLEAPYLTRLNRLFIARNAS